MKWQAEMDFMTNVLKRMRLQVHILRAGDTLESLDDGLRGVLGMQEAISDMIRFAQHWTRPKTIYKVVDSFRCCYIHFLMPIADGAQAVVIGPYLTADLSHEEMLEIAQKLSIPLERVPQMEEYFASKPVLTDPSPVMALVGAFGEALWGGEESFDIEDVNFEHHADGPLEADIEQTDPAEMMRRMEERYAFENEMLEIVSKGLTNRAEGLLAHISRLNFSRRTADPLRNMKNYCIICNTLMRKAAEQGGVHPLHLDRMSGTYARKIENAANQDACYALIRDMLRSYSRLVRTHSIRQYSAIVQRVMTFIDANLAGDLDLQTIAKAQQVSRGYLSALFHRETGRTLIEHITERRMKAALQLLTETKLQIQAIAQLCGFADPNYFGKQFKRFFGVTPALYRKMHAGHIAHEG